MVEPSTEGPSTQLHQEEYPDGSQYEDEEVTYEEYCRERNLWQRPHRICLPLLDCKARGTRLYHDQDTWNPPLNLRWLITQHVTLGKNTCLKYGWLTNHHVTLRKGT